jgi:ATP-dependent DNA helicase DinG
MLAVMSPTRDPSPDDLIPEEPPLEALMPADDEAPRESLPYEMRTGEERDGPPPPRPDVSEQVVGFFGPDSPLHRAPEVGGRPYEERPQQLAMARASCVSWHAGEHLCVEAPAGVGWSLA